MKYQTFFIYPCIGILLLLGCSGSKATKTGGSTITKEPSQSVKPKKQKKRIVFDEVESNDVPLLIKQANDFLDNNQIKKAIPCLRKVKQLKPDSIEIRKQLVDLYKEMKLADYEITELKELVAIKPDNTYRIRCIALLREKKAFDDAINVVEDIRAVDPENIAALLELGQIYKDQKLYTEAIEILREITYIDSKNAMAKYYQAEIYFEQNKPLWADKYYKDALKMDPALGLAEYGLAKIAKMRKSEEEYQKHLERAYELNPEIEKMYME